MKVHQTAQADVDAFLEEREQDLSDRAEEARRLDEDCAGTFRFDEETERELARREIGKEADREGWTAQEWHDAMMRTYLFNDSDLAEEFRQRQTAWDIFWEPEDYIGSHF